MIASFQERRAINGFVRQLGPVLERRFGRKRHYSPKEVKRGGRDIGAPPDSLQQTSGSRALGSQWVIFSRLTP